MWSYFETIREYVGVPTMVVVGLAFIFFVMQLIGEVLEWKNKVVPEFMKIRKYFQRKKQERQAIADMMETLPEVKKSLDEFNAHYSKDNIQMRNDWMNGVDQHVIDSETWKREFREKLDKNIEITMSIRIENMRSEIIGFAQYVVDEKNPVTHEQFNRIFKLYAKYEAILEENKMTNGEADTAMRIINEAYEDHMRQHTFIEDTRWT